MSWIDTFWNALNVFFASDFWLELLWRLLRVGVIIGLAFIVRAIAGVAIRRGVDRIVNGVKAKQRTVDTQEVFDSPMTVVRTVQRTRTMGTLLSNVVNITLVVLVVFLSLETLLPGTLTSFALLGAAVAAGLGFGAQNVVKDILNGLFMVFEDQMGVGDIVDLGEATGMVEAVTIRITRLRDVNGTVWFVRNGEVQRVGNMSHGWARVIIDLALPHKANIDEIEDAMLETAMTLAHEPGWRNRVVEKPEIWGIEYSSEDAVITRIVMKVKSYSKDDVARELRMRLKTTLHELGVKEPILKRVHVSGFESASRVKGARPPKTRRTRTGDDVVVPKAIEEATKAAEAAKTPRAPRKPRTPRPPQAPQDEA